MAGQGKARGNIYSTGEGTLIMKKNSLQFKIITANKNIKINGLSVTKILLENKLMYSDSMLGNTECHMDNHQLLIGLKGLLLNSEEQVELQQIAFQKKSVKADISNNQFEIKGSFQIQKYEIDSNTDNLDSFAIDLICRDAFEYNVILKKG